MASPSRARLCQMRILYVSLPVPFSLPAMPNVNRAEGGKGRQLLLLSVCVCVCGWGRGGDNCTFVARKNYQSCAALPRLALPYRCLCRTNKYQLYAQQQHEHVAALSLHFFCCSYNI